jgi:hypothetical protein
MAGHPRAWAAVGASNDAVNQSRTAGWKDASGSAVREGDTARLYRLRLGGRVQRSRGTPRATAPEPV